MHFPLAIGLACRLLCHADMASRIEPWTIPFHVILLTTLLAALIMVIVVVLMK